MSNRQIHPDNSKQSAVKPQELKRTNRRVWSMRNSIAMLIILGIGIFLRFDRLTSIPPSLSHDESAIAYNAYSILKTGRDEYGARLPLLFRSFDDYKLPGMVYSTVPFVALFGKSELAARLPSAVYGTLTIVAIYALVLALTASPVPSLFAALMLAIQPWHVNFSRQLFESNGAVFWFVLGTYFLARSRRHYGSILWAGLSYVVALYFYYSVRLVIPFVALYYLITQWKTIRKQWKVTALTVLICLAAFAPLGWEMLSPGGWQRINTVSVVNDPNYIAKRDHFVSILGTHPSVINKILYNRRVALAETVIENYWKNISPHNLLVTGTGTYGALYPFDAVLFPLGLLYLFTLQPAYMYLVLLWLFCAFLPGAFSINQPNTLRTLIAAPVFAILSGFGMTYIVSLIRRKPRFKSITISTLVILVFWFIQAFPKFHYAYFVNNPVNNALAFADGTKQMVSYVKTNEQQYDRVYISGYFWRPYIFMLYWGNTDPVSYQKTGNREHFGKYYFTSASWDTNGIKLMDAKFDFKTLPHTDKTLFILAYPEYQIHQKYFEKVATIDGRHTPHVFIAATLK
jgi:4-amino-4-deoxy-L-arabinose transferase-like glycosyltransferase